MDCEVFAMLPHGGCNILQLFDRGTKEAIEVAAGKEQEAPLLARETGTSRESTAVPPATGTLRLVHQEAKVAAVKEEQEVPAGRLRASVVKPKPNSSGPDRAAAEALRLARQDNAGLRRIVKEEEAKFASICHQLTIEQEGQQLLRAVNKFLKVQLEFANARYHQLWEQLFEYQAGRAPSPALPPRPSSSKGSQTSAPVAEQEAAALQLELQAAQQRADKLSKVVREQAGALEASRAEAAAASAAAEEAARQLRGQVAAQAARLQQLEAELLQAKGSAEDTASKLATLSYDHGILKRMHEQTVSDNVDLRSELGRLKKRREEREEQWEAQLQAAEARAEAADQLLANAVVLQEQGKASPASHGAAACSGGSSSGGAGESVLSRRSSMDSDSSGLSR